MIRRGRTNHLKLLARAGYGARGIIYLIGIYSFIEAVYRRIDAP